MPAMPHYSPETLVF